MASIKSLTEAQCGSEAPLVILSHNVSQSRPFMQPENLSILSSKADVFSQEYLLNASAGIAALNTFDMTAILQPCPPLSDKTPVKSGQLLHKWCTEYEQNSEALVNAFVNDYANSRTSAAEVQLNEVWNNVASFTPITPAIRTTQQSQPNSQLWASDFLDKFDSKTMPNTTIDSMSSNIIDITKPNLWINEFLSNIDNMSVDYKEMHDEAYKIFSNYENEWYNMSTNLNSPSVYTFSKANAFANELNPLERAQEFFKQGNIFDAILCYEAALQRNPNDAKSWCSLGLCHAENEQDYEAIAAYRRSLDLDPINRRALLASAVSMANEGAEMAAMGHLDQWLLQFNDSQTGTKSKPFVDNPFVIDSSWINQLEEKFLDVVSHSHNMPAERLSEIYNALGVFYNLTNNYEKAVESMRAAISINPGDAVLWNRLGASLANSDRSPEAIGAYRKALELFPAYVRARYNLGISCMNMNAFHDAIGHFLNALQLQKSRQNAEIWSKLRSCLLRISSLSLPDTSHWVNNALNAVEARDIDALSRAYTHALITP